MVLYSAGWSAANHSMDLGASYFATYPSANRVAFICDRKSCSLTFGPNSAADLGTGSFGVVGFEAIMLEWAARMKDVKESRCLSHG